MVKGGFAASPFLACHLMTARWLLWLQASCPHSRQTEGTESRSKEEAAVTFPGFRKVKISLCESTFLLCFFWWRTGHVSTPEVQGHGKSASLHQDSTDEEVEVGDGDHRRDFGPREHCKLPTLHRKHEESLIGLVVPITITGLTQPHSPGTPVGIKFSKLLEH